MNKYVIAVDMDGVLYPFVDAFNLLYKEATGEQVVFDGWLNFANLPGEIVNAIWRDPRLFQELEPYEEALDMMEGFATIPNVEAFIVTSPGREIDITIPAKWAWLQKWFPMVDARHFVTLQAKEYFKANLLIEDYPENILAWLVENPANDAIMIKRPWNEAKIAEVHNYGVKVFKLENVLEYTQGLAG